MARRYTAAKRSGPDLIMRWLRRRFATVPSIAADTALTLVAATFAAVHLFVVHSGHGERTRGWAVALAVLCASCLLVRSRWPIGSLVAVGIIGSIYLATGNQLFAIIPAGLAALYSAVAYSNRPRGQVWAVAIAVCVAFNVAGQYGKGFNLDRDGLALVLDSGWMATALLLGESLRGRRAYAQEAELRAVQAERTQQEAAQRRVIEERLQIARELHDIVAHTIALINVQAGVAAHVIDQQPEQAREALNNIKLASRATLQELRAMVGVLREGDGPAPLAPAPGLDAVGGLIDTVRDAGLNVDVEVKRADAPLPSTVDLAAYRILQEALTNVIKYAGPAAVRVSIQQDGAQLKLDVTNDGSSLDPTIAGEGSGHGIAGMRERAAAIGGSLQAGPLPGGGFRVHATLPVRGGAA